MKLLKNVLNPFFPRYQIGLEITIKGSQFIFGYNDSLCYKCHKIILKLGGWYIDSPGWIKNKMATTNPIYKYEYNCFQYTVTLPLNHKKIKKLEKITKIKLFVYR